MHLSRLKKIFDGFLSHEEKRVLMLKGKWGVGKTYAWKEYINANPQTQEYAYSYVSLFGVRDLSEIQQLIFQNAVPKNFKQLKKISKVAFPILNAVKKSPIPFAKASLEAAGSVATLLIRRFLICIDDIERKPDGLPLSTVLGFISVLKEEYNCRIVLILNDDQIVKPEDKDALKKYREKIVDLEIAHEPTTAENVRLIFKEDEFLAAQEVFERLGINNIRVIKFTYWNLKYFEPLLGKLEKAVRNKFQENVAILTAIYHHFGYEADFSNLKHSLLVGMFSDKDQEPSALERYIQRAIYFKQDYDLQIGNYLQTGICDEAELQKILEALNAREKKAQIQQKFARLWGLFNDNFQANTEEILEAFERLVNSDLTELHIDELIAICNLFEALGRGPKTKLWLSQFVDSRLDKLTLQEADNLKQRINDPAILVRVKARELTLRKNESFQAVIYRMVNTKGWSQDDEALLDSLSEDDYFEWFVSETDKDFLTTLRGFYRNFVISNNKDIWKSIRTKLEGALKRVAKRSDLDRYRIKHFFAIANLDTFETD